MKGDFQVRFCERLRLKRFGLLDRSNFGYLHRCTLVRAGRNSVGLLVVILYFYFFIGLQFRAGQSTMPCLHKALFVTSYAVGQLVVHNSKTKIIMFYR